jgi:hypothetical protein
MKNEANSMEWINVKYELPIIPKGQFSIQVIVATFDWIYEEINPGRGHGVYQATFDGEFKEWYHYGNGNTRSINVGDPVTHWMYLPSRPINYDPLTGENR